MNSTENQEIIQTAQIPKTQNTLFMNEYINKNAIQAMTFGVVAVLLGMFFITIFGIFKPDLPQECEKWNENFILQMVLFLVGFTSRYLMSCDMIRKYMID